MMSWKNILQSLLGMNDMVNYIWVGMTVIGVVFAMINGTMDDVNKALIREC